MAARHSSARRLGTPVWPILPPRPPAPDPSPSTCLEPILAWAACLLGRFPWNGVVWASPAVPAVRLVSRAVRHLRATLAAPAGSTATAEGPASLVPRRDPRLAPARDAAVHRAVASNHPSRAPVSP